MTSPLFLGAEIYRGSSYAPWHPLRVPRVSTVMDLCRATGWLGPENYLTSPCAKPPTLQTWHRPDYLDALLRAEEALEVSDAVRARYNLGTASNPVFAEMYRRPATAAAASMLAGEMLASPGKIYSPAGGTHHGMPGQANGFCYLNDPALGILALRRVGVRRIAYVDIDAHHPDGVEHAFAGDPDVLMISTHEERRWPFTGAIEDAGAGQVFNLPVPRGFNDSEMREVRKRLILPALDRFAPEAIVLQCGADAVEEDPLSRLALSNNAHWKIVAALARRSERLLVLGGGGYNPWAVGRLWSGVWAVSNGFTIPDRLPPAAEAVLRGVAWTGNSRARNPDPALFTTLRDASREGPVRAAVTDRLDQLVPRIADLGLTQSYPVT